MSTCFFIGHRETSDSIFPALLQAVERHITEYGGYRVCGGTLWEL